VNFWELSRPPTAEFGRRLKKYGHRKSDRKYAAGIPAVTIIPPPLDFCPAVEFDTIKFGSKVLVYNSRQDGLRPQEMGSGALSLKLNPSP